MRPTDLPPLTWPVLVLVLAVGPVLFAIPTQAQNTLYLVNDSTEVASLRFRFVDGRSFSESRLRLRLVTTAPGFARRVANRLAFLPFVSAVYPSFNPVELQRDMVRLTNFYRDNGFLSPFVDYPASQFDASKNRIHVLITVREGPPLIVKSRAFRFDSPLDPSLGRAWTVFAERLALRPSDRFTEFGRVQLEGRLRSWMQDRGYAFARAAALAAVDSNAHLVDLELVLDPGIRARIDSILVEGEEAVSERVITRQLPFRVGDVFKADALTEGQRSLFGLNVFRFALADVPDQPEDSTVTVRIRVREAPARLIAANAGYSRENGLETGASWRHRNFMGAARQLSVSGAWTTGFLATSPEGRQPVRSAETAVSLRQPYLFERRLSGSGTVFYRWIDDPNQIVRYHEVGASPSVLFQFLPFRSATVRYSISRAIPILGSDDLERIDVFDRSVLSMSLAFGKLNNYLYPRRGWMVRPSFELAGLVLGGGVSYSRASLDASVLVPITMRSNVSLSMSVGKLMPSKGSRRQSDPQIEYRFDPIRFYSGGASDVRGWGLNTLGPRWVHADSVYQAEDGSLHADGAAYESAGGLAKISGRLEGRFPLPGFGDSWRIGMFLDFGGVASRVRYDADGRTLMDANGLPEVDDRGFVRWNDLQFGTGAGIRYLTPVGAMRLDLAWKINPDDLDLQSPEDRALFEAGFASAQPSRRFLHRFALHLSIDRAF